MVIGPGNATYRTVGDRERGAQCIDEDRATIFGARDEARGGDFLLVALRALCAQERTRLGGGAGTVRACPPPLAGASGEGST
jgi:hypothetical protein